MDISPSPSLSLYIYICVYIYISTCVCIHVHIKYIYIYMGVYIGDLLRVLASGLVGAFMLQLTQNEAQISSGQPLVKP